MSLIFKSKRHMPDNGLFRNFILNKELFLLYLLLSVFIASNTTNAETSFLNSGASNYKQYPQGGGLRVSATFGPDGRLWRIVPEKKFIYVDYSTDLGKTFSVPVRINKRPQHIKVSRQNRPDILVNHSSHIFVTYTAKINHVTTQLVSRSDNNGKSFSVPAILSKNTPERISFLGRLAESPSGQVYIFWLDERDHTDWRKPGYSIYSADLSNGKGYNPVNKKIATSLCECCRMAVDFDTNEDSVLFARFIYPDNIRDHGLIRASSDKSKPLVWRVTFDQWKIRGCSEHGPAISINKESQYHIAWFTQGSVRQGLFYAHSSDQGKNFSEPFPFGNLNNMPGYPDILAVEKEVYLTWKEFDGVSTRIIIMKSEDGGLNWLPSQSIAESSDNSDIPFLLKNDESVFVSWNTEKKGYLLIPLN
jgi:hypothetical protein